MAPARVGESVNDRLDRLEKKIDAITELPMRTLKWLGTLIVGATITMLVQGFLLHQWSNQATTQAAHEATVAAGAATTAAAQVNALAAKQGTP